MMEQAYVGIDVPCAGVCIVCGQIRVGGGGVCGCEIYTLKLLYGFCQGTNIQGTAVVNTSGDKSTEPHFNVFRNRQRRKASRWMKPLGLMF